MTVLQLDGLEWHDGWLASVLRIDDGRFYAACAVAIDWNRSCIRFALCQISQVQAASLSDHYKRSGFSPELNEAWKDALSGGPVYLIDEEPYEGGSFNFVESNETERELLMSYPLPLVDIASSEEAQRTWLNYT